ncbi:MAG: carboxypeptidase regulatory-like domain-containing protein [Planctomycetota bacterium]
MIDRREFMVGTAGGVLGVMGGRVGGEVSVGEPDWIVGRVCLEGKAPEPKLIDCRVDWYCHKINSKKPLRTEDLLVGKDKGLQNVFVRVKSGLGEGKKWPVPKEPVILAHRRCMFVPHVLGIMVGQPLVVINTDKTLENTHGLTKLNKPFNFNQPRKGMRRTLELTEPESFKIKCDVHPWEIAYCHVLDHPFYGITDKDGDFVIKGLPAGEYELEFWHEKLGIQSRKVTVTGKAVAMVKGVKFRLAKRKRLPATRSGD